MRLMTWMFLAALLCAGLATTASAGITGIELMTSTVMQEKQSSFSGLAGRMKIVSPVLIKGIEILPGIEYWRSSTTVDAFGLHTVRKDATLGGDMRYMFRQPGSTRPYLGAGFAIHFLDNAVDAPGLGIYNQNHAVVKSGLTALGGVSFPLSSRFDNFVELKYLHVPDYRQLKFNWGLGIGF